MRLLVEKILHAYESNGNLHLVLGVTNGQRSASGEDLYEPVATIVVPRACVVEMIVDMTKAQEALCSGEGQERLLPIDSGSSACKEFLGSGLKISS